MPFAIRYPEWSTGNPPGPAAVTGRCGLDFRLARTLVGVAIADPAHDTAGLPAVGYIGLVISSVMLLRVVARILRREAGLDGV